MTMWYRPPKQDEDGCIFHCPNKLIWKAKLVWRIFKKLERVTSGYVVTRKNQDGSFQITEEATMVKFDRKI